MVGSGILSIGGVFFFWMVLGTLADLGIIRE
jgi:hypothetical protein